MESTGTRLAENLSFLVSVTYGENARYFAGLVPTALPEVGYQALGFSCNTELFFSLFEVEQLLGCLAHYLQEFVLFGFTVFYHVQKEVDGSQKPSAADVANVSVVNVHPHFLFPSSFLLGSHDLLLVILHLHLFNLNFRPVLVLGTDHFISVLRPFPVR